LDSASLDRRGSDEAEGENRPQERKGDRDLRAPGEAVAFLSGLAEAAGSRFFGTGVAHGGFSSAVQAARSVGDVCTVLVPSPCRPPSGGDKRAFRVTRR